MCEELSSTGNDPLKNGKMGEILECLVSSQSPLVAARWNDPVGPQEMGNVKAASHTHTSHMARPQRARDLV